MAQVLGNNQVKLDNGKVVNAQQGGWYDGQQFWGGTLSAPGQINSQSNQVGAGQMVSSEVNRQSDAAQGLKAGTIDAYLANQRAKQGQPSAPIQTVGGNGVVFPDGGGGGGMGAGFSGPSAINLPDIYKTLYEGSGIREKQDEYDQMARAFTEARGKINDNPWLSEATRVGREAKLTSLFDQRTANIKNEIATRKADVETQLNMKLKQFDIDSQQAQQALSQFNTLLSMGALSGASGEDIAQITRSTGIPSSMIQSAIQNSQKKDVKTQVITSTDDNGVVTASVINTETGDIIAKNNLGAIGNKQNSGGGSGKIDESEIKSTLIADSRNGVPLPDVFRIYSGYLDPNQILNIYNSNSSWGPAKESWDELAKYGVKAPAGSSGF